MICRLTAPCVRHKWSAARVKLRWRATVSKICSALSGGSRRIGEPGIKKMHYVGVAGKRGDTPVKATGYAIQQWPHKVPRVTGACVQVMANQQTGVSGQDCTTTAQHPHHSAPEPSFPHTSHPNIWLMKTWTLTPMLDCIGASPHIEPVSISAPVAQGMSLCHNVHAHISFGLRF